MQYIKWGLTAATFALVMSVGLGLIAGVGALIVFLRALLFTVIFFAFGSVLRLIITYYFPELLYAKEEAESHEIFEKPGSRINITVDTAGEYAVPELYKTTGDSEKLGNIEDLISGYFKPHQEYTEPFAGSSPSSTGIDRYKEEGYNMGGDFQSAQNFGFDFQDPFQDMPVLEEKAPVEKPSFTPSFVDDSDDLGDLPDLDAMAMAFSHGGEESVSNGFGAGSSSSASGEEFESAQSYHRGNKPQPLKGDFDPKELAKGISTVLRKDK